MGKVNMEKLRGKAKKAKVTRQRKSGLPPYEKLEDRKGKLSDIVLGFGAWKDWRVSEMLDDSAGQNYIANFILGKGDFHEDFKNDIIEVCERCGFDVDTEEEEDIPY